MHKTIFPGDFLADFGFLPVRSHGRVELARLELGGLQPVDEGAREKVLRVVREAFIPHRRRSGRSAGYRPVCSWEWSWPPLVARVTWMRPRGWGEPGWANAFSSCVNTAS